MEVFLKIKKALEDLAGESDNPQVPGNNGPNGSPPTRVPNGQTPNDHMIYNRNENPWQDNPHHGNFPPGFMFGKDRTGRGGLFSEMDREFEEFDRSMQNFSKDIGQMFKDLAEIEQNMQSTSISSINQMSQHQSVRIQIRTNKDGELEEHRTVTTIGPDGIPHENITVRTLSDGSASDPIGQGSNLDGPIDPFQLLFGQIPGHHGATGISSQVHDPMQNYTPEDRNRNLFLRNEPPKVEKNPVSVQKQTYNPKKFQTFEIPDYAKQMRESIEKMTRP